MSRVSCAAVLLVGALSAGTGCNKSGPAEPQRSDNKEAPKENTDDEAARLNKTIADASEGLKRHPEDMNAFSTRAAAYKKKREYKLAIADYTEVIRLNAGSTNDPGAVLGKAAATSRALLARGECYDELGEHEKATADYKEANRTEPSLLDPERRKRIGK